jgi:hypothetical protein
MTDQGVGLSQDLQDCLRQFEIASLAAAADIIDFSGRSMIEDVRDPCAMILYMDPFPFLEAIAVQWQRLVLQCVRYKKRDELLRVLVRTKRVASSGDENWHSVGGKITPSQEIARCLARRVGAAGHDRVGLFRSALRHIAIHLISADLDKLANLGRTGGFQEDRGPYHIGPHKSPRLKDRAVNMGLGGKVRNRIDAMLLDETFDGRRVADITMYKLVAFIRGHIV